MKRAAAVAATITSKTWSGFSGQVLMHTLRDAPLQGVLRGERHQQCEAGFQLPWSSEQFFQSTQHEPNPDNLVQSQQHPISIMRLLSCQWMDAALSTRKITFHSSVLRFCQLERTMFSVETDEEICKVLLFYATGNT